VIRYAAALLYCKEDDTIAGLKPHTLITCGSPHAGVRGTLNGLFEAVLRCMGRQTAQDMLLSAEGDAPPLLLRMARDEDGLPFISALSAFHRLLLYANVLDDSLCPYATSALLHYNYEGEIKDQEDTAFVAHHTDAAGIPCADLAVLQIPGVSMVQVYDDNCVQRRIVESLRANLAWERFDLSVPKAKQNFLLGAHTTEVILACAHHLVDEVCEGGHVAGIGGAAV